jgi:hypothetical protein
MQSSSLPLTIVRPLKDDFHAELDLARAGRGLVERGWQSASVSVVDGVVLAPSVQEAGGEEIRVIEYVEELGTELNVHRVRDDGQFGVFEERHVECGEMWAVEAVASGVSYDVRAELAAGGGFGR